MSDRSAVGERLQAIASRDSRIKLYAWTAPGGEILWQVDYAPPTPPLFHLCLASGIHGDEPAGVEALLRFLEGDLPEAIAITAFPNMNPEANRLGLREDAQGRDLNRFFNTQPQPAMNTLFEQAIWNRNWDLFLDLHEDYQSQGFYLLELVPLEHTASPAIVKAIAQAQLPLESADTLLAMLEEEGGYPILGVMDGWARISRSEFPEGGMPQAPFMANKHARDALTFETPNQLPMETRVQLHLVALRATIEEFSMFLTHC